MFNFFRKNPHRNPYINPQEYAWPHDNHKPSPDELCDYYFVWSAWPQKTYKRFSDTVWITRESMVKLSRNHDVSSIWKDIKDSRSITLQNALDILGKVKNF